MRDRDFKTLKDKSLNELQKLLLGKYQDLTKNTLERHVKQIKNNRVSKNFKTDIAKIKTLIREKTLAAKEKAKT